MQSSRREIEWDRKSRLINIRIDSKKMIRILFALGLTATIAVAATLEESRVIEPFDAGWRFLQSEAEGAEAAGFDDSKWTTVNAPHDWSITGPFAATNKTGGAGGFLPSGVGWYRKQFTLPEK